MRSPKENEMIQLLNGDIFESKLEALVCPVNCVGVMGKGLAKEFKKRYPFNFEVYQSTCEAHRLKTGGVLVVHDSGKLIVNFPTKNHWKNLSKLEYIKAGIKDLVETIQHHKIKSIAIPALGCGCGGLKWEDVRPMIIQALGNLSVWVELYEP